MELRSRNTNTLQDDAYALLRNHGIPRDSRNGPVLVVNEPVSIELSHPWERVNFDPLRDANPFFHLWEGLAMLGGLNSVHLMAFFAKNMLSFTDDGLRYNAFYGERARVKWGDQLKLTVDELKKNPDSRQCVVNLWDPTDWLRPTKDKACNLMMLFSVDHEGKLRMTSYNRSNDAIFGGVTGANIVHLSLFQEYVARSLDRPMGPWWHVANNFHVYTGNPKWDLLKERAPKSDYDAGHHVNGGYPGWFPLLQNQCAFDTELAELLDLALGASRSTGGIIGDTKYTEPFLQHTAVPVFNAYVYHKAGRSEDAIKILDDCHAEDWKIACQTWIGRRQIHKAIAEAHVPQVL
jgi:hypothetical protein